jgi:hypothetical protein
MNQSYTSCTFVFDLYIFCSFPLQTSIVLNSFFQYKIHRITLSLLLCFVAFHALNAQERVAGSVIVSFEKNEEPEVFTQAWNSLETSKSRWKPERRISEMLNAWLLIRTNGPSEDTAFKEWLSRQNGIRFVQFDHLLSDRSKPDSSVLPNDPFFDMQWQLKNTGQNGGIPGEDLGMEAAWSLATGGLTSAGDTIVVAVIDGGVQVAHPDLAGTFWKNRAEIPNDDIDNDNNGYIDDYRGWNVYHQNDDLSGVATNHGTPICGIIGARTNNSLGIAGINWNIQTLFVAGKGQESVILESYDYVWKARKRYNETNGTQGAFVVAVNCSWGVDYGQPADAPLWCEAFEELGAVGILSIGATANLPVNVDVVGDLPTTCPSPYLIAVSSIDSNNELAATAAWGQINIDIAAYGEGVFTTQQNSGYGTSSGTSFAAPQLTGAIGLLYAAACPNLISIAKSNPAAAALWTRQLILESSEGEASLLNLIASGARLQIGDLLGYYNDLCVDCPAPFSIEHEALSSDSIRINWSEVSEFSQVNLRWRKTGENWNLEFGVEAPFLLSSLEACTNYEVSLRANCYDGTFSGWSPVYMFNTGNCCNAPYVHVDSINDTSVQLSWAANGAAQQYRIAWRNGLVPWQTSLVGTNSVELTGLEPCTEYDCRIQMECDSGWTDYSDTWQFQTSGCGACLDIPYCPAYSENAWGEWISTLKIGGWQHQSTGGSTGYQDLTNSSGNVLILEPDVNYPISITPGFSGLSYKQFFRVYIDYNGDGIFDPINELAFDPGFAHNGEVSGTLSTPVQFENGLTRMRVLMKYETPFNEAPLPCEVFEYGEVEDYCVQLGGTPSSNSNGKKRDWERLYVYPNPSQAYCMVELPENARARANLCIKNSRGQTLREIQVHGGANRVDLTDFPAGVYLFSLHTEAKVYRQVVLKQ